MDILNFRVRRDGYAEVVSSRRKIKRTEPTSLIPCGSDQFL